MAFEQGALSGTAYLTVEGLALPVVDSTGYGVATTKKTSVMGMSGYHGFKVEPVPGFIKAKVRNIAGLSVADFEAMVDVTVSLELTNGKRASGNNLVCVEAIEVDGDENTIDLRFEGADVQEN